MEELDIRGRILKGAEELFTRYGLRSVTMDDIARQLAMSKKTIYQTFRDKDEIVLAVTRLHLERQSADFREVLEGSKSSIDHLVKLSLCMRRNLNNINPSLLYDLAKYHKAAWDEWVQYKNEFIRQTIIDVIKKGIEEGTMRTELNPEILSVFRMEQIQMVFDEQIYPRNKFSFIEVQMQLFDHFAHGLFTDKGRKMYQKLKETEFAIS